MKRLTLRTLFVLLLLVVVLPLYAMPEINPERDDPPGPIGGGGGGCSYCSAGQCGCAAPPAGYYLVFDCTCSSVQCTRSCDYYPL